MPYKKSKPSPTNVLARDVVPGMELRILDCSKAFVLRGGDICSVLFDLFYSDGIVKEKIDTKDITITIVAHDTVRCSRVMHQERELVLIVSKEYIEADSESESSPEAIEIYFFADEILEVVRIITPDSGHSIRKNRRLSSGGLPVGVSTVPQRNQ